MRPFGPKAPAAVPAKAQAPRGRIGALGANIKATVAKKLKKRRGKN
jgi:hypothetical protein